RAAARASLEGEGPGPTEMRSSSLEAGAMAALRDAKGPLAVLARTRTWQAFRLVSRLSQAFLHSCGSNKAAMRKI
ncbi:MAG: hypothetical protein ACRD51_06040, partial [Candidatus Acidiferrum sp.]